MSYLFPDLMSSDGVSWFSSCSAARNQAPSAIVREDKCQRPTADSQDRRILNVDAYYPVTPKTLQFYIPANRQGEYPFPYFTRNAGCYLFVNLSALKSEETLLCFH